MAFKWIGNKIKKILGFEEEKETYPQHFAIVKLNPIAKMKGVMDEHNKIIEIVKNGKITYTYDYTPQLIDSIQKIDPIPVYYEEGIEEDFEFDSFVELGTVRYFGGKK